MGKGGSKNKGGVGLHGKSKQHIKIDSKSAPDKYIGLRELFTIYDVKPDEIRAEYEKKRDKELRSITTTYKREINGAIKIVSEVFFEREQIDKKYKKVADVSLAELVDQIKENLGVEKTE